MKSTKSRQSNFIEQPPRRRLCTSWIVPLLLLWMLPAGLGLMSAGRVTAQTFRTLYNFGVGPDHNPQASLILSGNTLYGVELGGNGYGVPSPSSFEVFAINTDGTGFTSIYGFNGGFSAINPGGLILSGNTLYGTAGTIGVFAVNTDGTGFTNFGFEADAALILSGNTLYGTTINGGSSGQGTVFAVNTDGTAFAVLHSFTATSTNSSGPYANSDGAWPRAGLILSGKTLYGTAYEGGPNGEGTVFAINTDGTGFTVLHSFTARSAHYPWTNSDGAYPQGGLILSGNTLYGTASEAGPNGTGTVFAVNTNGTGFTNLHSFTGSDGSSPLAGLILSGNTLYGMASGGGTNFDGTVFSISFPPRLTLIPSGPYMIVTWPTNYLSFDYTGYTLQSTTNLGSAAVWATNSSQPVVIGGENVVINTMSGRQQFFRLSQ